MIEMLLAKGLDLVANAFLVKGKEFIEDKAGIKLTPQLTPQEIVELQKWQSNNQIELQKLLQEDNRIALQNTQSAREREATITVSDSAPLLNKIITPILAIVVVLGGGIMMYTSPEADVRTGASNLIMLVLGYYFGTSLSSHNKTELLKGQQNEIK